MMESAHARQLDDTNGNNKLDDGRISPNPDFTHAVGQIVAGTAVAPYYTREDTPLKPSFLSSQAGDCLFEADDKKTLPHLITQQQVKSSITSKISWQTNEMGSNHESTNAKSAKHPYKVTCHAERT